MVENDQKLAHEVIKGAINEEALCKNKTIPKTKLTDMIGWRVDLTNETFGPSIKGINKMLVSFFFVDYNKPLSCKVFQLLASLAERYSAGISGYSAFVSPLHARTAKRRHLKKPSASARFCIDMWRIICILLYINPNFMKKR